MMHFTLDINTDGAAFHQYPVDRGPEAELSLVLRKLATRLVTNDDLVEGDDYPLVDSNGNTVGHYRLSEDAGQRERIAALELYVRDAQTAASTIIGAAKSLRFHPDLGVANPATDEIETSFVNGEDGEETERI